MTIETNNRMIMLFNDRVAQLDSGNHNQLKGPRAIAEERAQIILWIADYEAANTICAAANLARLP